MEATVRQAMRSSTGSTLNARYARPATRRYPRVTPADNSQQGSVSAVWGSLIGLALMMAFNPALLGIILLVISRPRPVQNLLVCWVGCLITNVPGLLIPLMVLHLMPMFRSTAGDLARPTTSTTVQHIQLGMGVLALSAAAVIAMRARSGRRGYVTTPVGNSSTLVLDSKTPTAFSPPERPAEDATTERGSVIRRLISRVNDAWENGALWVALVIGMSFLPGPPLVLFVDTTIVASGAAIGTQIIAAMAFVVAMLAVFEITLMSYLAAPAKTLAVLRPLHDWALAHRLQVLVGILAMVGLFQVVKGMGII
jgi:Sap, sulfolipid-1-addressing protein